MTVQLWANITGKNRPHHVSKRASEKPRPTHLPGYNGALQSTHIAGLIPEKTKLGPGTLSLLHGKDPPLCSVNGDHVKSLDFHLCFVVTRC